MQQAPGHAGQALQLRVATDTLPTELFRLAVEQAAVAISITDVQARILYANPCFERVTGYSLQELIGQNESLLSYRVTPKSVYQEMWQKLIQQQAWTGLLVNRRKDGSRYLVDITITPVVNAQGETTHYLGLQHDVTEVHQLEYQVQNQRTLLESAVAAARVALVLVDDQLQPVLTNTSYKQLQQRLAQDPLSLMLAVLKRQQPELFNLDAILAQGFKAVEVALDLPQEGSLWFSCDASVVAEQDASADAFYHKRTSHYLLVTLQDISELKRQQEAQRLNSLQALLAEQERIQSVREALSGAMYQLERPLNLLNAATRLLERRSHTQGDSLQPLLEEVKNAGRQALDLLQTCMPEASAEPLQQVNLNELLRNTLSLMTSRLLANGITLDWHPQTHLHNIYGQPTRLTLLFKQLLENAIDALAEQGSSQREIHIQTRDIGPAVEVLIQDTGPGIPPAEQLSVFEPFYSTRNARDGHLGMGLTLVQDVVNAHHGLVEIDPDLTTGCLIKVQLPYA